MESSRLEFQGTTGERLVGRLDLPPDGEARAFALFAHCFTCSKDLKAAVNLSRALTDRDIGVFRFDFTGLGESEGDFADTDFSSNVGDLVAAARHMERELEAPRVLVGHSLGGAAVIRAAADVPACRAVATLGAPADPGHVRQHLTGSLEEIREEGEAEVSIGGRPFRIRRRFLEDLEETRMQEAVESLDRALLIFHSPVDQVVGVENAARLYGWARHPKSFVSLDDADHLLTDERDSRYAGTVLAAWASRYVEELEGGTDSEGGSAEEGSEGGTGERARAGSAGGGDEDEDGAREGHVVARLVGSGFYTELAAGGHSLAADEPRSVGGTDRGPTPYDLTGAALASCTAMTLRMYADRKDWPLEEVVARVEHDRVHADDCEECDDRMKGGRSKVDLFRRQVEAKGDLDPEQRERLLEIADRCPVSRTLKAGALIENRLAD